MNARAFLIGKIFLAFLFVLFLPLGFQNCSSTLNTVPDPILTTVPDATSSPTSGNEVGLSDSFKSNEVVLQLKSQPSLATNTSEALFELAVSDEKRGSVHAVLYKLDNGEWSSTTDTIKLNDIPHGNHQIQFKAVSKNGTESSVLTYQWMVDLKKPKIAFNMTPQPITGRDTVTFLYSTQEDLSGIHHVSCLLNGNDFRPCGQDGKTILSGLSPGDHKFEVIVSDKAGNTSDSVQYSFKVDLQAPWIEFSQHPDSFSKVANVVFNFRSTSIGNVITSFQCQLDAGEFQACQSPFNVTTLSEGNHRISVRGLAEEGYFSQVLSYQWIFDASAPTVAMITNESLLQDLKFQFSGSDGDGSGIKGFECGSSSAGPFLPCASPYDGTALFTSLHPGENEFFVRAKDSAGNNSELVRFPFFLKEKNIPFITLNLSGGAALSSNVIPLNSKKQLLTSYSTMGMGLTKNLKIEEAFGAKWYGSSGLLMGIKKIVDPSRFYQVKVFSIANKSQCDTTANKLDASGMIQKAGLRGTYIGNLGTQNTSTGVDQSFAVVAPTPPTIVQNVSSFFTDNPTIKNLNPMLDGTFKASWVLPSDAKPNQSEYIFGTLVFNSLNHNAGPIGLNMGGFDYHDGTRSTSDFRDFAAGVFLGKILNSALKLGPAFISVTTDGGISSGNSDIAGGGWIADNPSNSTQLFFIVDPTNSFSYKNYFIGAFNENQIVDDSSIAANSTEKAAAIVVCNYMKFNGNKDCSSVIGNKLTKEEIVQSTILEAYIK